MSDIINDDYVFLFQARGERRVNKVFKACKKYLSLFQKSVFRGNISPSKLLLLEKELRRIIDSNSDFICIIKLMNNNVFGEDILGTNPNATGEDLII